MFCGVLTKNAFTGALPYLLTLGIGQMQKDAGDFIGIYRKQDFFAGSKELIDAGPWIRENGRSTCRRLKETH